MSGPNLSLGLGEMRASRDPAEVVVCYGLGSCVGLVLYDPVARVAGMAHVVLPEAVGERVSDPPGKYANRAVPALLAGMERIGAERQRLRAYVAGGARMLTVSGAHPKLDVGARNVDAIHTALQRHEIALVAADTGGSHGRTMWCEVGTGRVLVTSVGKGERAL